MTTQGMKAGTAETQSGSGPKDRQPGPLADAQNPSLGQAQPPVEARTHNLKCWPEVFEEMLSGRKTAEFRLDDRDYRVGDGLLIWEWDPKTEAHSYRTISRTITHVLKDGFGVPDGYAMLSLAEQSLTPVPTGERREAVAALRAKAKSFRDAAEKQGKRVGPLAKAFEAAADFLSLPAEPASTEPFGYWVEQKHAEPVLLRKPAYIPEPSPLRTVTPLYATPKPAADLPGGEVEGPQPVIVEPKTTCTGCRHLVTKDWREYLENDETDSGTSARCAAKPTEHGGESISEYWHDNRAVPAWCPFSALSQEPAR